MTRKLNRVLLYIFKPLKFGTKYRPCRTCVRSEPATIGISVHPQCCRVVTSHDPVSGTVGYLQVGNACITERTSNSRCGARGKYWMPR